jgi:hypothetical protein
MSAEPRNDNIFKHAALAFVIALAGYVLFYSCDARLRTRKGPWVVDFSATTNNEPLLVINQPALGIQNVRIQLSGEQVTNTQMGVRFDRPKGIELPYGRIRFHDLTYLPGTITLDLFGHEVEMLPRAMFINTRERPWQSESMIVLSPTNKIPGLKDRDRKGRR